jgi:serine/threonine protein kinase
MDASEPSGTKTRVPDPGPSTKPTIGRPEDKSTERDPELAGAAVPGSTVGPPPSIDLPSTQSLSLGSTQAPGFDATLHFSTPIPPPSGFTPARLGHFELLELLGHGGQGDVFLAYQFRGVIRFVALKVLKPHLAKDPARVERLEAEVKHYCKVKDPSILPIYEFDQIDGCYYISMELVRGSNLSEVLRYRRQRLGRQWPAERDEETHKRENGEVTRKEQAAKKQKLYHMSDKRYPRTVVDTLLPVIKALAKLHANGLVHRDVKPANILLEGYDERFYLADFGLARDLEDDAADGPSTKSGTLPYMEFAKHSAKHGLDEKRSDVYSMGVTLFESLTLVRPFQPEHGESWAEHLLNTPTPSAREREPRVSRDLDAVVKKAMAREPLMRYAHAGELAADLEAFTRGEPPWIARPPDALRWPVVWLKRHRNFVTTALVLAGLAVGSLAARQAFQASQATQAEKLRSDAVASLNDGRVDQARDLVQKAEQLDPNHPELTAVRDAVFQAVLERYNAQANDEQVEGSWYLINLLLDLKGRGTTAADRFARAQGLREVHVQSDRAGTRVLFHPMDAFGRPVFGVPLVELDVTNIGNSYDIPFMVPGMYWVTALAPGGAWCEFPFHLKRLSKPGPDMLWLRPRPNADFLAPGAGFVQAENALFGVHEVTIGQLTLWLNAQPALSDSQKTWLDKVAVLPPDLPATSITRDLALEFARDQGMTLPEYARLSKLEAEAKSKSTVPLEKLGRSLGPVLEALDTLVIDGSGGGTIYGLRGNAAEMTLFHYDPAEMPVAPLELNPSARFVYPIRAGLLSRTDGRVEFVEEHTETTPNYPPDQPHPLFGFRLSRPLHPRLLDSPRSSLAKGWQP